MRNVLMVYGSQRGSTAEIARRMKGYLESRECIVDAVAAAGKKTDLSKYDLVVIGSGIYGGFPHKDIGEFTSRNRSDLTKKKVAVFAVSGDMASPKEGRRKAAQEYTDKVACELSPICKTVFAGKIPDLGWLINTIGVVINGAGPGDYRDWDEIKSWTLSLADRIAE